MCVLAEFAPHPACSPALNALQHEPLIYSATEAIPRHLVEERRLDVHLFITFFDDLRAPLLREDPGPNDLCIAIDMFSPLERDRHQGHIDGEVTQMGKPPPLAVRLEKALPFQP